MPRDPDVLAGQMDYLGTQQMRGVVLDTWDDWTEGSGLSPTSRKDPRSSFNSNRRSVRSTAKRRIPLAIKSSRSAGCRTGKRAIAASRSTRDARRVSRLKPIWLPISRGRRLGRRCQFRGRRCQRGLGRERQYGNAWRGGRLWLQYRGGRRGRASGTLARRRIDLTPSPLARLRPLGITNIFQGQPSRQRDPSRRRANRRVGSHGGAGRECLNHQRRNGGDILFGELLTSRV